MDWHIISQTKWQNFEALSYFISKSQKPKRIDEHVFQTRR